MRRRFSKFLMAGMLLGCIVQNCGCGTSGNGTAGIKILGEGISGEISGTYSEETIVLPENVTDIWAIREVQGVVWMVTDRGIYTSSDQGTTWQISAEVADWMPEDCSGAAIGADASLAFYTGEGNILVRSAEGAETRMTLEEKADHALYTMEMIHGNMLVLTDTESNIQIVDMAKGEVKGEISADEGYHYLTAGLGEQIVAVTGEETKFYDSRGEMLEGSEILDRLILQNLEELRSFKRVLLLQDLEESGLYYVCRDGLYHYTMGGSVTEKLMDGAVNYMGDRDSAFYRMAVLTGETFLIAYRTGSSEARVVLRRYAMSAFGEEASQGEAAGELTVYTLYENALLEQEINTFNRENPGCTVSLQIAVTGENGVTREDALKTLNTELLAGTGPDIILLDSMPVRKYCESGLLEDLSGILGELAEADGVYENIAYAYEQEGKVYAVPARFRMPVMVGREEDLSQIGNLESLVELTERLKSQNPEMDSILGMYDDTLLQYLYDFCSPVWMNDDGSMDSTKIEEFLWAAKRIEDIQKEAVVSENVQVIVKNNVYDDDNAELDGPLDVAGGNQALAFYNSKSLNFSATFLEEQKEFPMALEPSRGQSSQVFIPREILGINARGTNLQLAAAFVRQFLGVDCQSQVSIEDTSYPVNRNAFAAMEEFEIKRAAEGNLGADAAQEGFEKIAEMVESLDTCSLTDQVIRDTVTELGLSYLREEITLEEAVNGIMQRVNLYMAE